MKRFFLPAGALVLVLAACGGGHHSSAERRTHPQRSIADWPALSPKQEAIAAARKRVAGRKAEKLLGRIPLPARARPTRTAPAVLLTQKLGVAVRTMAYRHRYWKMREPLTSVMSFMGRHLLPGCVFGGSSPGEVDFAQEREDLSPARTHWYSLTFARRDGWTFVRADVAAGWIAPPHDIVPDDVRRIDIHIGPTGAYGPTGVNRAVTRPATVTRIARLFDQLNIVPSSDLGPNGCGPGSTPVSFVFRAAGGAPLARAEIPASPALNVCNLMSLAIHGGAWLPLLDVGGGRYALVNRVQRLLGVCFRGPMRSCR